MKFRRLRPTNVEVKALRATLSIAVGAVFFAAGLALGDFTGSVLMLLGCAAFLSAVS